MNSFFDSGPLPDWKDIQKWLGKDIPWNLVEKLDKGSGSAWLNQYVQDIMKKSKPNEQIQRNNLIQYEAEKDNRYVNVTIRLAPETDYRRMQLFATSERLKLIGLPGDKIRAIRFPCLVYARSGTVVAKKDRLLIRFKRRPQEKSEFELFIPT